MFNCYIKLPEGVPCAAVLSNDMAFLALSGTILHSLFTSRNACLCEEYKTIFKQTYDVQSPFGEVKEIMAELFRNEILWVPIVNDWMMIVFLKDSVGACWCKYVHWPKCRLTGWNKHVFLVNNRRKWWFGSFKGWWSCMICIYSTHICWTLVLS